MKKSKKTAMDISHSSLHHDVGFKIFVSFGGGTPAQNY